MQSSTRIVDKRVLVGVMLPPPLNVSTVLPAYVGVPVLGGVTASTYALLSPLPSGEFRTFVKIAFIYLFSHAIRTRHYYSI